MKVPVLTTDQMREVDRVMVEDLHIDLAQMMENAGRLLASLARERFLDGDPQGRRVLVLAGAGGNGGGGLVAARRLHGWGAQVRVVLSGDGSAYTGVPRHQLDGVARLGIKVLEAQEFSERGSGQEDAAFDVVLDAIIGYGLEAAPRGAAADLVRWALATNSPVLSLDVPSGLDATFGVASYPTIRARATLTPAYPKTGLLATGAAAHVGDLYVGDIGVPPQVLERPGLGFSSTTLFARTDLVAWRDPAASTAADIEVSIRSLLQATGRAHHQAFADADGVDPKWAQWYGRHVCAALEGLVGKVIGAENLGLLLAEAERLHTDQDAQAPWETFYSHFLIESLSTSSNTWRGDG